MIFDPRLPSWRSTWAGQARNPLPGERCVLPMRPGRPLEFALCALAGAQLHKVRDANACEVGAGNM